MIDLTKDQILAKPIKCWVRDEDELIWTQRWLVAIANKEYSTIGNINHSIEATPTLLDVFRYGRSKWDYCSLTDPTIPTKKVKKWETVMDIPPELWGKVLVKHKEERPQFAVVMSPYDVVNRNGMTYSDLHYLPLGQPLDSEWLPFESEVVE